MTTRRKKKVGIRKFISPLSRKLAMPHGGGMSGNECEQCTGPDGECEQCTGPDMPTSRIRRLRNVRVRASKIKK